MASRRASKAGKDLIKERRTALGWLYTDPRWAIAFGKITQPEKDWKTIGEIDPYRAISESSMRRFQCGQPIAANSFNVLCHCLSLDPNIIAESLTIVKPSIIIDLIDMPKDNFFCGRQKELQEIEQWLNSNVPFLNIWGAAGVGKSSLIAYWINQQTIFSSVIWQSVDCENIEISCKDFVDDFLGRFIPEAERGKNCFQEFNKLLSIRKILIVIDGNFNDEYYQWFKNLVRQIYSSCVIVVSESNLEVVLSNRNPPKAKEIVGLNNIDVGMIWNHYTGDLEKTSDCKDSIRILRERYDGNPSLLKMVIELIIKYYGGNLSRAMDETTVIPNGFKEVLEKRFDSFPDTEQQILIAMAKVENKISLEDIKSLIQQHDLVNPLETLRNSSVLQVQSISCGENALHSDEPMYSISSLWRKYLQRRFF